MPIGPAIVLVDMRRSTMPFRNWTIMKAPLPFCSTDSRSAGPRERRVVIRCSFGCGCTPIIQRAGPSSLA